MDFDLADILVDYEDSQIIAILRKGEHEEAEFLSIVGFRASAKLLAVTESDYYFPPVLGRTFDGRFFVLRVPLKILHEKDGFQIFHQDVDPDLLLRMFLSEQPEVFLECGKIQQVAFEAAPVEESHNGAVHFVGSSGWRGHKGGAPQQIIE
jgi:hypothetical protein